MMTNYKQKAEVLTKPYKQLCIKYVFIVYNLKL